VLHPSRLFRGTLIRFAGIAIVLLILLSVLWIFFLATPYNRALATVADKLSGAKITLGKDFAESDKQALGLEDEGIYVAVAQPGVLELHGVIDGLALDYGMLLLICFIAATPGMTWRQRLKFIPIALIIMFIIHIVTILIFAQVTISSTAMSPTNKNPWVNLFITAGCDLFPLLIWGALSYKYWSARLRSTP
jgi:hypothetical protein